MGIKDFVKSVILVEILENDEKLSLDEKILVARVKHANTYINFGKSIYRSGLFFLVADILINWIMPNIFNIKSYINSGVFAIFLLFFLVMYAVRFYVENRMLKKLLKRLYSKKVESL